MKRETFWDKVKRHFPYYVRARLYLVGLAVLGVLVVQGLITSDLSDALAQLLGAGLLGMALANARDEADDPNP